MTKHKNDDIKNLVLCDIRYHRFRHATTVAVLPTIHTPVGLNDSGKNLVQYRFLTSEVTMFEMMLLELLLEASDKTIHLLAHRN